MDLQVATKNFHQGYLTLWVEGILATACQFNVFNFWISTNKIDLVDNRWTKMQLVLKYQTKLSRENIIRSKYKEVEKQYMFKRTGCRRVIAFLLSLVFPIPLRLWWNLSSLNNVLSIKATMMLRKKNLGNTKWKQKH